MVNILSSYVWRGYLAGWLLGLIVWLPLDIYAPDNVALALGWVALLCVFQVIGAYIGHRMERGKY